jgi:tetraacyldisaccharide 4'-kinase
MIRTPDFWMKRNAIAYLLLPLSAVYFVGLTLIRFFARKKRISKPIICIGNLTAGGSGKTPTAIAIGQILKELSVKFAFLSRGYMNDGSKFLMLKKGGKYNASQVGDEPILLSEMATTFVAKNRFFGASQIESMRNIDVIVLDDGMQNNLLHFDYTIMVVDGTLAFGNEFLIPAGPMREPLKTGLKHVDLVVAIGSLKREISKKLKGKKIIHADISPLNAKQFQGKKLVAFAGLAYPQKFFAFLKSIKLDVVETKSFVDHYSYKKSDLDKLVSLAKELDAELITTKKDWVKFSKPFKDKISYLDIELKFKNEKLLKSELKKFL